MKTLRAFGSFALVSSALAMVACGGSGDPAARIDATQSAFSNPTGDVTAASAELVITRSQTATDLNAVLAFANVTGACAGGGDTSGTIDLSCASGGSTTGTADYSVEVSVGAGSASTLVSMTFHDACKDGVCVDGTVAESTASGASGSEVIVDADVDVTRSGAAAEHVHLGVKTSSGVSGSSVSVAIFDDADKSFVLDASATAGGGSVSIRGANGSFSCSYESGGDKGSCSGSGSFTW
jgi:hypothetical protein